MLTFAEFFELHILRRAPLGEYLISLRCQVINADDKLQHGNTGCESQERRDFVRFGEDDTQVGMVDSK